MSKYDSVYSKIESFLNTKFDDTNHIIYSCPCCGMSLTRTKVYFRQYYGHKPIEEKTFLCTNCKIKKTNLEKYGVEHPFSSKEIQEKIKKTNLEKYGCENPFGNKEIQEKIKKTNLEKFGVDNPAKSKEVQERAKKTCLKKYGGVSASNNEDIKSKIKKTKLERYGSEGFNNPEKAKKTNLSKYGVSSPLQNSSIYTKMKNTNLERYGVENTYNLEKCKRKSKETWSKNKDEIIEKQKKTTFEKYGVEFYAQTRESRQRASKRIIIKFSSDLNDWRKTAAEKYNFSELSFDSSWELAYFIWLIDNNIDFEYQCDPISYTGADKKTCLYFPDFKVGDKYIEIKGDQFFTEEGKLINPYDRSQKMDEQYERKQKCMQENNVVIFRYHDIEPYLEYVRTTYGNNYLKSFKEEDH